MWCDHDDGAAPGAGAPAARAAVHGALPEAQRRLRGVVLRRLRGDHAAADDVLQRFALRALERAAGLRDPARVHGWLARVLASTLADHGRAAVRRRERPGDPRDLERLPLAAEEGASHAEVWACDCIGPLLGVLRPDQAALIRRLDLAEEPGPAVAADLGVSPNALHVRHHRARRALAGLLLAACVTCPEESFLRCACPKPAGVAAARRARRLVDA